MDDITGPAEIYDQRYGARGKGFEHHTRTIVAKCWKNEHISKLMAQCPENIMSKHVVFIKNPTP